MPRRGQAQKREVVPDPVFHNKLVARLISQILKDGKRSLAEEIVYDAFAILKKKGKDPVDTLNKAVEQTKPLLEVKPRRVGGATYQVPVEVSHYRGTTLCLRWMASFARERKGKPMCERLADELLEAAIGQGASVKKKVDLHKMAEANRAFAHYRW